MTAHTAHSRLQLCSKQTWPRLHNCFIWKTWRVFSWKPHRLTLFPYLTRGLLNFTLLVCENFGTRKYLSIIKLLRRDIAFSSNVNVIFREKISSLQTASLRRRLQLEILKLYFIMKFYIAAQTSSVSIMELDWQIF